MEAILKKLSATKLTRSLFMYPGYLSVVVLAAITEETREFVCENVGLSIFIFSSAIRFNAVLSRTTTLSLFKINLFKVKRELQGCTTTSTKHSTRRVYIDKSNITANFILIGENTVCLNQFFAISITEGLKKCSI